MEDFLSFHGLSRYITKFNHVGVDLEDLIFVQDEQDLVELGVDLSIHRRKLISILQVKKQEQLKQQEHQEHQEQLKQHPDGIPNTKKEFKQQLNDLPILIHSKEQTEAETDEDIRSASTSQEEQEEQEEAHQSNELPTIIHSNKDMDAELEDKIISSSTSTTSQQLPHDIECEINVVPSEEDMLGTEWANFGLEINGDQPSKRQSSHMESDLREEYISTTATLPTKIDTDIDDDGLFLQIHDTILETEHASFMELEEQLIKYKQQSVQDRAERYQQTIENERVMIDLQCQCDEKIKNMKKEKNKIQKQKNKTNDACAVLRKEIQLLSNNAKELQKQLKSSSHDTENVILKRQVNDLKSSLLNYQNENEMLKTKLQTAEEMKLFLTNEWEKTEEEAKRTKEQLLEGIEEKGNALEYCAECEELLAYLASKLKIEEDDRGLRLAVKEEWSRFIMDSRIMKTFFVVEREVNMIPSWRLRNDV